ncbi:hypothetical protein SDC9_49718 [bioreactor metagenome]|uniref:Uncharacterized protein n=1 Tax=bioreactor metagenome TaxID=1076179 RepID=A0A644WIV5_9ZZZZ
MGIIAQIIRSFILGIVAAIVFAFVSIGTVLHEPDIINNSPYSKTTTKEIYEEYTESFHTVQTYIDEFDLASYETDGKAAHILIDRFDADNSEKTYGIYVCNGEKKLVEASDEAVTNALDTLFNQAGIEFIVQQRTDDENCVYFGTKTYKGLVYSSNGKKPQDTPAEVPYYFSRVDGNWFYWIDNN